MFFSKDSPNTAFSINIVLQELHCHFQFRLKKKKKKKNNKDKTLFWGQ